MQKATWKMPSLVPIAEGVYKGLVNQKRHGAVNSDWWAVGFSFERLTQEIKAFTEGTPINFLL